MCACNAKLKITHGLIHFYSRKTFVLCVFIIQGAPFFVFAIALICAILLMFTHQSEDWREWGGGKGERIEDTSILKKPP